MASQVKLPEISEDIESYFRWLNAKSGLENWELAKVLYETDFRWMVDDDKNRAEDGLKWRDRYAMEVGIDPLNVSEAVLRDRIRKSIHGKTSCYEVILSLSENLDSMVNEDEESMTPMFFGILIGNLGLLKENSVEKWQKILEKWLDRCDTFTIFPVTLLENCDRKVSQTASLWMLMNHWLEANSDENGHFVTEKCHNVTLLK